MTTKPVVFLGPSLDVASARRILDATYLPPAARGDVYRACAQSPRAIVLIDGYFDRVPAVWHKEILWAISRRIPVIGAASMGALRAAELADFGMIGVGDIYEKFSAGEYEDDDEVALVHASAEEGYAPLSEPLVNIRATLAAACREGVLRAATANSLAHLAKRLGYWDREYRTIVRAARAGDSEEVELDAFERWLQAGRVNQKSLDAIAALKYVGSEALASPPACFDFAHTHAFAQLTRSVAPPAAADTAAERILEELIVDGRLSGARLAALERAARLSSTPESALTDAQVQAAAERFRRERGILSEQEFTDWIDGQGLDDDALTRFFEERARLGPSLPASEFERHLFGFLVESGSHGAVAARAAEKQRLLDERGPTSAPAPSDEELFRRYFTEVLRRAVPADVGEFVRGHFGIDLERFRRALLRESAYLEGAFGRAESGHRKLA